MNRSCCKDSDSDGLPRTLTCNPSCYRRTGDATNMTDIKPVVYQYYYKVDGCEANDAYANDCICWHPEGFGPNQKERHDSDTPLVMWRKLYPESALLQAREEGRREVMLEAREEGRREVMLELLVFLQTYPRSGG